MSLFTTHQGEPELGQQKWETPPHVFYQLDHEFLFTLDPCATADNAKCRKFFTEAENGLEQDWSGERVFMNPPYGEQGKWLQKAYEEAQRGALVVCLVRADTSTAYWHDWCMKGEIRFIRGRVSFGDGDGTPNFASVIVVFRPKFSSYLFSSAGAYALESGPAEGGEATRSPDGRARESVEKK